MPALQDEESLYGALDYQITEHLLATITTPYLFISVVTPFENLKETLINDTKFYTDDSGFIHVYTDGSYRVRYGVLHSEIGVWFGPNHEL